MLVRHSSASHGLCRMHAWSCCQGGGGKQAIAQCSWLVTRLITYSVWPAWPVLGTKDEDELHPAHWPGTGQTRRCECLTFRRTRFVLRSAVLLVSMSVLLLLLKSCSNFCDNCLISHCSLFLGIATNHWAFPGLHWFFLFTPADGCLFTCPIHLVRL